MIAILGRHFPMAVAFMEAGRRDSRAQLYVGSQIQPVSNKINVSKDLRLRRIILGPAPLLLDLVGERVGVLHALDVAARARISVPKPCSADAVGSLKDPHLASKTPQTMERIQTPKARANDE